MALKIKLQRGGATHNPIYRIVVAEARGRRDGRFVEKLGTYIPRAQGQQIELTLDVERAGLLDFCGSEGNGNGRRPHQESSERGASCRRSRGLI